MDNRIYNFSEIESMKNTDKGNHSIIKLFDLDDNEKLELNPLIPPTSGLRMKIFEISEIEKNGKKIEEYKLTASKFFKFLRFMKGMAIVAKRELNKDNPSILIVCDDRPSGRYLLEFGSKIFSYEGYSIYHQKGEGEVVANYKRGKSTMGTPFASASISLFDEIDVVLMITASHNSLVWNGLKFYIQRPIPISGGVMKATSKIALELSEIEIQNEYTPIYIDADEKNENYILSLIKEIVDVSVLQKKKILLWPMLGVAPEIKSLIEKCGAEVILIEEDRDPPDPTKKFDQNKIIKLMEKNSIKISIILDADRDRIVFLVKTSTGYKELSPNELYVAMHKILSNELKRKIINIRTIPSHPGSDDSSVLNFITGVGYKHLGIIQYLMADKEVPQSQLNTGILYYKNKEGKFIKIRTKEDVQQVIKDFKLQGDYICVLWEESGGHTFNLVNIEINNLSNNSKNDIDDESNNKIKVSSNYPLIGDKYPAIAILMLCILLEMGYDLASYGDDNILGSRTGIKANDTEKIQYMDYFKEFIGKELEIAGLTYEIGAFTTVEDEISTIHLHRDKTDLYIRPSGTGDNIKVYVYGPKESYLDEMNNTAEFMKNINRN